MRSNQDTAPTPSALIDAIASAELEPALLATIIFHPDTRRIGETALLGSGNPQGSLWVGRGSPLFVAPGSGAGGRALEEPYISRQALLLAARDGGLVATRPPRASRCRLAGEELVQEYWIDPLQLDRGLPLLLGHSVVLWLYRDRPPTGAGCSGVAPELLGTGSTMAALRTQIGRVAGSDNDLLLCGATGTGKELAARAIHRASRRGAGPLVAVNMAAIPPDLAPALLFGAARGAFTGAERDRQGYFGQADNGTLFLDEIGDTPPQVQPQLLRALQQREIQPVGGRVRRVDVRVLSATDAEIEGEGSSFRAALRHRLGAIELHLPALRQHREDLGVIGRHLLAAELEALDRSHLIPGPDAAPELIAAWAWLFYRFGLYDWPGNVRELENVVRAVALESEAALQLPPDLYRRLRLQVAPGEVGNPASKRRMAEVSDEEFARAYALCRHRVATTARRLGVSRQAVYRRLERLQAAGGLTAD